MFGAAPPGLLSRQGMVPPTFGEQQLSVGADWILAAGQLMLRLKNNSGRFCRLPGQPAQSRVVSKNIYLLVLDYDSVHCNSEYLGLL
jgi:hypothetical protein